MDNKTLRTKYDSQSYVIVSKHDGVNKYISKDYDKKHAFQYTVLLKKAKKFDTFNKAEFYKEERNIEGEIKTLVMRLEVIL